MRDGAPSPFILIPFPGEGNPAGVTIGGSIARRADTLSIRYEVRGNLSRVSVPAATEAPRRKDRLWEETCLEFFLGMADSPEYWEFNLSPSGNWNVYRFARYREGMREETAFASLPLDVRRDAQELVLTVEIDAGRIVPTGSALTVMAAAVIGTFEVRNSHWAPVHTATRPDFHRRDPFAWIRLT
jgi:hypothetical protein